MDALELLRNDHQKVSNLFDRFNTARSQQERWQIFQQLKQELILHSFIEETVFYPVFARYVEVKDLVEQSFSDHQQLKNELERVEMTGKQNQNLQADVEGIREIVEDQVRAEEHEFFPEVRKLMKRPEREQLGRHLQSAKEEPIAA